MRSILIKAWCKTIVICYITKGSYNSLATSPQFEVDILMAHKTITHYIIWGFSWQQTGNYVDCLRRQGKCQVEILGQSQQPFMQVFVVFLPHDRYVTVQETPVVFLRNSKNIFDKIYFIMETLWYKEWFLTILQ